MKDNTIRVGNNQVNYLQEFGIKVNQTPMQIQGRKKFDAYSLASALLMLFPDVLFAFYQVEFWMLRK